MLDSNGIENDNQIILFQIKVGTIFSKFAPLRDDVIDLPTKFSQLAFTFCPNHAF